MENTKKCLECGRNVLGRADKKFCSDACRSAYNNRLSGGADKYVRKVNRILKKNHSILIHLNPEGKARIYKDKLSKAGFNFEFYTNVYLTKDQKEYRFCYDQGYLLLSNDLVLLVQREERN